MSGCQNFCGSFMIPVTMLCIVMFAETQAQILPAKPNYVTCQINKYTNSYYTTPKCIYSWIVKMLCIVMFAETQAQILPAKPNLLPERKSLNVKVLFIK
jgi:hypothetical protein